MKHNRILIITPYSGMAEIIRRVSGEFPEFHFHTEVSDMRTPDAIRTLVSEENCDVIMTSGTITDFVRNITDIPCVEIPLSFYDILFTIRALESFPDYRPIMVTRLDYKEHLSQIKSMIGIDIPYRKINNDGNNIEDTINSLVNEGYAIFIGDDLVWNYTQKIGVPCLLLMSGLESVKEACKIATEHLRQINKNDIREAVLRYVISKPGRYWHIEDQNGKVWFDNFEKDQKPVYQETLKHMGRTGGKIKSGGFRYMKWFWEYSWCKETIDQYGVFSILRIFDNTELNESLNAALQVDEDTYVGEIVSAILHSKDADSTLRQSVEDAADSDLSVLLSGEEGTGRNSYARMIHLQSSWKDSQFVLINCNQLTNASINSIFSLNDGMLINFQKGTLYLAEIQALDENFQNTISRFLSYKKNREKYRLICSSTKSLPVLLSKHIITRKFAEQFCEICIEVPSVRETMDNFEPIVSMQMQKLNRKYGWRLSGIEPEGREMLKSYDWPGNLNQLKDVLKMSVANVNEAEESLVLRKDWIREAIDKTESYYRSQPSEVITTDSGTLEEIETQVILKVLAECNMNQTQAAKRLAIGRSTLRRKLESAGV